MGDVAAVEQLVKKYQNLRSEIAKVIVGQEEVVNQILISVFSGGHSLLVGVPGLAKTLLIKTLYSIPQLSGQLHHRNVFFSTSFCRLFLLLLNSPIFICYS